MASVTFLLFFTEVSMDAINPCSRAKFSISSALNFRRFVKSDWNYIRYRPSIHTSDSTVQIHTNIDRASMTCVISSEFGYDTAAGLLSQDVLKRGTTSSKI